MNAAAAGTPAAAAAAADIRHPLSLVLLTLTFTTGLIDAASFLGLGRVFTANMTGNVVLLGFGFAGVHGLPVVSPLVSLAAFLLGAGAGGRLAERTESRHWLHLGASLAIEAVLLAVAAILAVTIDPVPDAFSGDVLVACIALAMGVRNTTVRRIAVPDLTTTVLTGTLTSLAAGSRAGGGSGSGTIRRASATASMLAGALAGALLLRESLALPLACSALLALLALAGYVPHRRRLEAAAAATS
jgi:uncharacterized membrane protein YoaK (UPF0700 family)